jgi:hypothetical protein
MCLFSKTIVEMPRRRSSRSRSRGHGPITTLYSPVHHGIGALRNVTRSGIGAASSMLNAGLGGIDNAASRVASRANMALDNIYKGTVGRVMSRRRRRGGRRRSTRRRSTRRRR